MFSAVVGVCFFKSAGVKVGFFKLLESESRVSRFFFKLHESEL